MARSTELTGSKSCQYVLTEVGVLTRIEIKDGDVRDEESANGRSAQPGDQHPYRAKSLGKNSLSIAKSTPPT